MSTIKSIENPHIPLLEVNDLHVSFKIMAGKVEAVNGVSFTLDRGKILGIVGESGSGKSVSSYSIMQIIDKNGTIDSGSIKLDGRELIGLTDKEMREIRGNRIAMIFQDPMTALNPVYTIGNQLIEAIRTHVQISKQEAYAKSVEMLKLVGFNEPDKRMKQYPFEFSGGMLQRAVIAMALVCNPDLLIADEPTTALDVTIQAQILELLKEIQQKMGMAIIIITHDLGVVASICDEVDVMYAGRIVERGTADAIFYNPAHEYTKGLINSVPTLADDKELQPIKGNPVDLMCLPKGCSFAPRCDKCMKICLEKYPPQIKVTDDHYSSCWNCIKKLQEEGAIDVTLPPEAPTNVQSILSLTSTELPKIAPKEVVEEQINEEEKASEPLKEKEEAESHKEDKAETEEKPEVNSETEKKEETPVSKVKKEAEETKPEAEKTQGLKETPSPKKENEGVKKSISLKDFLAGKTEKKKKKGGKK
jgi:oligopeptide transport system ATP-binding protein